MILPVYMRLLPIYPYGEETNLITENTEKLIVMKKEQTTENTEKKVGWQYFIFTELILGKFI